MIEAFDRKPARNFGYVGLAFVLGLAAGNGWKTREAIEGSGHWWAQYCHSQVQSHVQLQQKLDNE